MEKYKPKRAAKGKTKLFSWGKPPRRRKERTEPVRIRPVPKPSAPDMTAGPEDRFSIPETEQAERNFVPPTAPVQDEPEKSSNEPDVPEETPAEPSTDTEAGPNVVVPLTVPVQDEPELPADEPDIPEEAPVEPSTDTEAGPDAVPLTVPETDESEPPADEPGPAEEDTAELPSVQEAEPDDPEPVTPVMAEGGETPPEGPPAETPPEPSAKKKRRWPLVVLALLVVLAVSYVILCAVVDESTSLLKTTVNGVDVSGMTQTQIAEVIQDNCETVYGGAQLQVSAEGETYTVEMGPLLEMDADGVAEDILNRSGGTFWKRGYYLLRNALLGDERTVVPAVADEDGLNDAIEASGLMEIDTTVQTTYELTQEALVFTMGTTGQSVDKDGLVDSLKAAVAADDYETVVTCPMLDGSVQPVDMDAVYEDIYQEAVNATLDPDNDYEIVASVEGIDFDKDAAAEAVNAAEEGSEVSIELTRTEPTVTTEKLKNNLFRDVLGECTTNVSGTANRRSNVKLAAEKINGYIMLAGDEFSYNDTVGERTAANGFKTAGAYLNGETVQEYGGGICQVSSTTYLAALRANLEITERHNHTYVSSYIEKGMDATVSWGGPDFKFKNDQDYPIKIVTSYNSSNQVTVQILGTNVDGISVEITNEILSWSGYSTEYREDSSMYEGESYTSVSGYEGGKVQTYRSVYDADGNLISKEKEAYSVYTVRNKVVYVGTKKKETAVTENTTDAADADADSDETDED